MTLKNLHRGFVSCVSCPCLGRSFLNLNIRAWVFGCHHSAISSTIPIPTNGASRKIDISSICRVRFGSFQRDVWQLDASVLKFTCGDMDSFDGLLRARDGRSLLGFVSSKIWFAKTHAFFLLSPHNALTSVHFHYVTATLSASDDESCGRVLSAVVAVPR